MVITSVKFEANLKMYINRSYLFKKKNCYTARNSHPKRIISFENGPFESVSNLINIITIAVPREPMKFENVSRGTHNICIKVSTSLNTFVRNCRRKCLFTGVKYATERKFQPHQHLHSMLRNWMELESSTTLTFLKVKQCEIAAWSKIIAPCNRRDVGK